MVEIVFWLCFILLVHTYVIYPLHMRVIAKRYTFKWKSVEQELPFVSVLMAAFNEEDNIVERIESTFKTNYPAHRFEFVIGSDASTDKTDSLIKIYSDSKSNLKFIRFENRTGKPEIINQLVNHAKGEILVLTDADTRFDENTLSEIVKPFSDRKVGGVQSHILLSKSVGDVGQTELFYNLGELQIKKGESVWGCVIGAFGSCYAIRKELYTVVPKGFLVDDFLIFCKVLEKGYSCVYAENAITFMEVDGKSETQFKRKVRIGTGNYQNLGKLLGLLNPRNIKKAYSFFSHKVLRWIGPFILIALILLNPMLILKKSIYSAIWILQLTCYAIAFADIIYRSITKKTTSISFVGHFVSMNFALLLGFVKFVSSKPDGTWSNK